MYVSEGIKVKEKLDTIMLIYRIVEFIDGKIDVKAYGGKITN